MRADLIGLWLAYLGIGVIVAILVWAMARSSARRERSFVKLGKESAWGTAPSTSGIVLNVETSSLRGMEKSRLTLLRGVRPVYFSPDGPW